MIMTYIQTRKYNICLATGKLTIIESLGIYLLYTPATTHNLFPSFWVWRFLFRLCVPACLSPQQSRVADGIVSPVQLLTCQTVGYVSR